MKFTFAPESKPLAGYTIKRAIHRGGFGEVYYAISDAGKEVALKLLQENSDVEMRGVSQCLNLKHPHLVSIFNVLQDQEGDHWIVMEYVSGKTLSQELEDHPRGMPMEEVRRWVQGIASGVNFLHSQGIVHRDLKPGNIFSDHGGIKVGDVGLSKFISPSKKSAHTQSVGTVYYMAPEVAQGKYGKQVDVYALGIMIYEMLTGRVPFDGESTGEILMKHLSSQPDLSLLPPRIRPVVSRALEKDPERRTSSIQELERQFHAAVRGDKIDPNTSEIDREDKTKSFYRDDFVFGWMFNKPARHSGPRVVTEKSSSSELLDFIKQYWWVPIPLFYVFRPGAWQVTLVVALSALAALLYFGLQILDMIRDYTLSDRPKRPRYERYWSAESSPASSNSVPVQTVATHHDKEKVSPALKLASVSQRSLAGHVSQWCLVTSGDALVITLLCAGLTFLYPSAFLPSAVSPQNVGLNYITFFVVSTLLLTTLIRNLNHLANYLRLERWQLFWMNGVVGILVAGGGFWWLSHWLLIDTHLLAKSEGAFRYLGPYATQINGQVSLAGYGMFLGILMALRSWNLIITPTRSTRFSIAAMFNSMLAVVCGLVLVSGVPWMWCLLWGALVTATLQIVSPMMASKGPSEHRYWRHA